MGVRFPPSAFFSRSEKNAEHSKFEIRDCVKNFEIDFENFECGPISNLEYLDGSKMELICISVLKQIRT